MRTLLLLSLLAGCGPTLIANAPKTVLLGQRYQPGDVRDAVARAINHRKLAPQGEVEGRAVALDTRHGATCLFTVEYTSANLIINASVDAAAPPPAQIDQRCAVEADALAHAIAKEVERPAKVAAKEERARRRHELAVENARAAGEQAALAREQLEQQQQQQQQGDPNDSAEPQPIADPNAYAPAPAPTVNYQFNNSVSSSTSTSNTNVTVNRTTVNQPALAQQAPLSPFLCCRTGQPYVCPNTAVYAAACVQRTADLARTCRLDPAQAPYCRH
ncbi:MAG TPA: hypothetical protein VFF06_09495 [Polyangia bacterium]|nr:hypothetical protein [Polyangia bacterium]